jgi:hypothetical protein
MDKSKLIIIWDFDGMIGQINSSMKYDWNDTDAFVEINNALYIQSLSNMYDLKQCFAVTGVSMASSLPGFSLKEIIQKMYDNGSEIASHSWKHEWFPALTTKQATLSLIASKSIIEKSISGCSIKGFVPPFTRPMTWVSQFNYSFGDRFLYPFHSLSNQDSLLNLSINSGYNWVRVKKRPIYKKWSKSIYLPQPFFYDQLICFPNHHTGFDSVSIQKLNYAVKHKKTYIINGHPLGLSNGITENKELFDKFICAALKFRDLGLLEFINPSSFLNSK